VPRTMTLDNFVEASSFSVSTSPFAESSMFCAKLLISLTAKFSFMVLGRIELIISLVLTVRLSFKSGFNSVMKLPQARLSCALGVAYLYSNDPCEAERCGFLW